MQGDRNGVYQMDPDEILIYNLYRQQRNAQGGLTRDHLPYTPNFDQMRATYNQQATQPLSDREFWRQLIYVLKYGEDHIDTFLAPQTAGS